MAGNWRVVVVDDEADMRRLLDLVFEMDDRFEVGGGAATAAEAIEVVERLRPDLVVLDHYLGGPVSGAAIARELRAAVPDAVIVIFSASEELVLEVAGADAVVCKRELASLAETAAELLSRKEREGSDPSRRRSVHG